MPPSLKCPSPGLRIASPLLAVEEATGWQTYIRLLHPQVRVGGNMGSVREKTGRQCH